MPSASRDGAPVVTPCCVLTQSLSLSAVAPTAAVAAATPRTSRWGAGSNMRTRLHSLQVLASSSDIRHRSNRNAHIRVRRTLSESAPARVKEMNDQSFSPLESPLNTHPSSQYRLLSMRHARAFDATLCKETHAVSCKKANVTMPEVHV